MIYDTTSCAESNGNPGRSRDGRRDGFSPVPIPNPARQAGAEPIDIRAAWVESAPTLAAWTDEHLVNRRDAYGHYIAVESRTDPDLTAYTDKGELTQAVLNRHFRGESTGDLIGLHATVRDEPQAACWSRWVALDIDRHDNSVDPGVTWKAARTWYDRALGLGFCPLLIDSNGHGGYHLLLVFDGPVATERVHRFGEWLARDWKELGLDGPPEVFPKQESIKSGGFGNWLRLPGRHHTRDHYTRVWDGSGWHEGKDAIKLILETTGTSGDKIPAEATKAEVSPPKPRHSRPLDDPARDVRLAKEALPYVKHMADEYEDWLRIGMCLTPLGTDGLALWDEWSKECPDEYDEGACERKWQTFDRDGDLTLGTLFHLAKENGWPGPRGGTRIGETKTSANGDGRRDGTAEPSANGDGHPAGDAGPILPNEAEDDPHRLARVYRDTHCQHEDGLTLRFWQGEWVRWDGGAYRPVGPESLRADLVATIKEEFDRLNVAALAQHDKKTPPPRTRKVTGALVGNVSLALSGYARLKAGTNQPTWLIDEAPFPAKEVLPTRNALVHLPRLVEGEDAIRRPSPSFFCPYVLDYDFDLGAPEPIHWLTFLGARPVTGESKVQLQLWPDDPQSIETLQEWFGYHLTPDTSQQKIGTLIGPKRSGKGTIARILAAMIGPENAAGPTLSGLTTNFGLAPLIGKPCAIISDARLSGRTDAAVVVERLLSVSGEDSLTIDRKHLPAWTGKLPTRFTLISNELPRLSDPSGALAGRLIILRLTRSFYGREMHELTDLLKDELSGILLWAIEGWRRLRERGYFQQPDSGRELVEQMEDLASPHNEFIKDRCVLGPGREIMAARLYEAWTRWCQEKGRAHPGTEQEFGRNLHAVLPTLGTLQHRQADGSRKRFYGGIGLVDSGSF